jgi:hypothetical protein
MITKENIEKNIKENIIFKESIEKLNESERQIVISEVDKIIDLFYSNIIEPLQNYNIE